MESLDEELSKVYKNTNDELIKLLNESQRKICRINIILGAVCGLVIIAFIFTSYLNYRTNIKWLDVFNSYEYETITIDSADGIANYIGEDGIINNGEDYSEESN